jgi:poly-beta-1,6-N-acetyl-D-glucosamine synthase
LQNSNHKYVLFTAVYNEERRIKKVIQAVLAQTILPERWIIVSDGSTDKTDEIVKNYAAQNKIILFARQEKRAEDHDKLEKVTIAQARAMALAREMVKDIGYEYFGNLDADITFGDDYYEQVIKRMLQDPKIGIGGGGAYSVGYDGRIWDSGFIQPDFVGGPVQFFRRKCLEEIDGYAFYGHSDCVAVIKARMKGWKVQCFSEIKALHHEQPGNSIREKVPICFRLGYMDHLMGGLLLFEIARCALRMFKNPYFVAGVAMLGGFLWARLRREPVRIPPDVAEFLRTDQKRKMLERIPLLRSFVSVSSN